MKFSRMFCHLSLRSGAGVICVSNEAAEVGHDDSGRSLVAKGGAQARLFQAGLIQAKLIVNHCPRGAKLAPANMFRVVREET